MENSILEVFEKRNARPPKFITEAVEAKGGAQTAMKINNTIWFYERKGYSVKRIDTHITAGGLTAYIIIFKRRFLKGFKRFKRQQEH